MVYPIIDQHDFSLVFILLKRSIMSSLEDIETSLPFDIKSNGNREYKAKLRGYRAPKRKSIYPVLIVETLPESFGKIDKNNRKKRQELAKEEEYLLNLIARIVVEIFIKEEL